MLQQIKQIIVTKGGENPQFSSTLLNRKIKQHSKKKKEFKIKKGRLNVGKKNKKQEGFSNPIYAGLNTQEMQNDNRLNFGPWIYQNLNKQSNESKRHKIHSQSLLNIESIDNRYYDQTQRRTNQIINRSQSQSIPNIASTHDLRFTQTKRKRYLQQLRCSSQMLQISKSVTLSPIKPLKINHSQMNKNHKSKSSHIELLKYDSLKYLLPSHSENIIDSNVIIRRPNAVIYNYCCSTFQNNLFGNDIDNLLLNRKKVNKSPLLNDNKEQLRQKQQMFRNTGFRNTQILLPIKKSINRELYDQLIKKKSKLK